MKKTTKLKQLIKDPKILVMPGVHDALSAKIAEKCGFEAVQCSGFGFAGSYLGIPDIGVLTLTQMVELTRNVCRAVDIPVMADGDTGFGNAVNVYYAVRDFEDAGAAGMNLEDQVFPKRCGHMAGKQIIPMEEAVKKIEAAVAARRDPDFVINARTDAVAVAGVDEAIRRGNAYAKAGADLIFVEAPTKVDDIKRVIHSIDAPVSINLLQGGRTPLVPISQLEEWGAARVSIPVTSIMAVAHKMFEVFSYIREHGGIAGLQDKVLSFEEFAKTVGLPEIRKLEARYLPGEEIQGRYGGEAGLQEQIKALH